MWTRRQISTRWVPGLVAGTSTALLARSAKAQDAYLELKLDTERVARQQTAILTAEVVLTQRGADLDPPQIRVDESVRVKAAGRSSSQVTKIINGQYSSEIRQIFSYELTATKAGRFTIDARATIGSRELRASAPVSLTVSDEVEEVPIAQAGDPIMLIPELTPDGDLYVGQAAFYHLELWSRSPDSAVSADRPAFKDFITEDFEAPGRRIAVYSRHRYEVQSVYYRAIFPQRAGDLVIDGLELAMEPTSFGSLFARRQMRAYRVRGPETKIHVKPLPAKGQPANFPSAHVGQFQLSASVDRSELAVGDAFTLTLTIEGTGNLRLVDPGRVSLSDGLRSYEPKREDPEYIVQDGEVQGVVRWRYLIVADRPGTHRIAPINVDYFDPKAGLYRKTSSSEIVLDVKGADGSVPTQADDSSTKPSEPDALRPESKSEGESSRDDDPLAQNIPAESLPRIAEQTPWLTARRFYSLVVAAPAIIGGSTLVAQLRKRVWGDARRQRARAQREELQSLFEKVTSATEGDFWGALGHLLQRLALLRAGNEASGLPRPELMRKLGDAGVSEADRNTWRRWLDESDAARFGASLSNAETRREAQKFAAEQVEAYLRERV